MSSWQTRNRSSFRTTSSRLLFGLLLSAAAFTANSAVSGTDKPKENAENSGAPDVVYPVDEFLDQCLTQSNHGSTAGQIECTDQAKQRWHDEMNQGYRRLADHLTPKTQASLRDAQRRWLQYRDADQLLVDAVYELTKGTMYAPMQAYSHLRPIRERSLVLKNYFTVFNNPKASQDLPLTGNVKASHDNYGSPEVDYPTDDSLRNCIKQHPTPSQHGSCVSEALIRWHSGTHAVHQHL